MQGLVVALVGVVKVALMKRLRNFPCVSYKYYCYYHHRYQEYYVTEPYFIIQLIEYECVSQHFFSISSRLNCITYCEALEITLTDYPLFSLSSDKPFH